MLTKLSELSVRHEAFYCTQKKHTDLLLKRQYIRHFIHRQFVVRPICGVDLLPIGTYQRLHHEPPFESQVNEHARDLTTAGFFANKTRFGGEPRRRAAVSVSSSVEKVLFCQRPMTKKLSAFQLSKIPYRQTGAALE